MACSVIMAQSVSTADLEKAANKGDVTAMVNLGASYFNNGAFKKAAEWFEKAVKKESALGKYYLAYMYLEGKGVKRNTDKAVKLMDEAAYANVADAQLFKGYWYENGLKGYEIIWGSEMDNKPMITYISPDQEKAAEWYVKAAANGNAEALKWVEARGMESLLAEARESAPKTVSPQALAELEKSAKKGDVKAMVDLGIYYFNNGSLKKASEWFDKAIKEEESPVAKYYVAKMHLEGNGKKRNTEKAVKLMEEAAFGGVAEAQCMEGEFYDNGLTGYEVALGSELTNRPKITYISRDKSKAAEWYGKAAASGNKKAISWLVKNGKTDRLPADVQEKIAEEKAAQEKRLAEMKAAEERKQAEEKIKKMADEFISVKGNTSAIRSKYESSVQSYGLDFVAAAVAEVGKTDPTYATELSGIKESIEKEERAKAEVKRIAEEKKAAEIAAKGELCERFGGFELRRKGDKYMIYNEKGTALFKDLSGYKKGGLSTGVALPGFIVWNQSGKVGYVNRYGKLVIPFGKYSAIAYSPQGQGDDTLIIVAQGGKVGAVNYKTGVQVIPTVYNDIIATGREGRMMWAKETTTGGIFYIITPKGKVLASKTIKNSQRYLMTSFMQDYGIYSMADYGGWNKNR